MNPLATHDGQPLVTVQVMACTKDIHLLPRALASVAKQDLPPEMFAVQIMHDGQAEETADLERVAEAIDRLPCEASFIETPEPYGYYCLPRNYGIVYIDTPYIAFLDADNEMAPGHLRGLLAAIRTPSPTNGWPHFVYSRRLYVRDDGAPKEMPVGPSKPYGWVQDSVVPLLRSPQNNFIDTGDLLVGKGVLMMLAEYTGQMFNPEVRRFGDWELVCRMAKVGFRGRPVDQVTNIYHWTGENLQLTRSAQGVDAISVAHYEKLKAEGKIK